MRKAIICLTVFFCCPFLVFSNPYNSWRQIFTPPVPRAEAAEAAPAEEVPASPAQEEPPAQEEQESKLSLEDTDDFSVLGTAHSSQQISVLEKEDIEKQNASDFTDLLQNTLGLSVTRYGAHGSQSGVTLRGFDSKRIAVLINGIPASSSLDGKFDFTKIDINSIERIEVIHGGSDSKYNVSGSFGGIINIITIARNEPGFKITAQASNTSYLPRESVSTEGEKLSSQWADIFDTQNYALYASYGSASGVFSLSASMFANRAGNHFVFEDRFSIPRRKIHNEVFDLGGSLSLMFETSSSVKFIYSSDYYYGDFNFPTTGFSKYYGTQRDFSARQSLLIDAPKAFCENLASELSLSWQFSDREYISAADAASVHNQNRISVINRWNWFFSDKGLFRTGFDYNFAFIDSSEIGRRNRHDGGFYITFEFKASESFLIIPSSKIVFSGGASANAAVIPKLGLLWNISDSFSVRNNYFRSFKFPDFEELYWSGGGGTGNPDLRPEDGLGADFGITWKINEKIQIDSAFFSQYIKDSIHWFLGAGGWRPQNVGQAMFFGLDGKISFDFPISAGPIKKIAASISYQYLLSFVLYYGYTFSSNKRIPYNPEHLLNGSLEFFWQSGSFLVSGQFKGRHYHDTANLISMKPVFLLNAAINQRLGKNFIFFGSLNNILNLSYESFYGYPMSGISFTLGIRFSAQFE